MQIVEYFLLELSLIFGYKLGMGKGSWVYADSVLCEDWKGRISSYDSVPVLQKLNFCVDLSTSQGVCLVSRLFLFWLHLIFMCVKIQIFKTLGVLSKYIAIDTLISRRSGYLEHCSNTKLLDIPLTPQSTRLNLKQYLCITRMKKF
jgi:hypothetical protein